MTDEHRLLVVARGEASADLVFSNARVVNTFTGEVEHASVAVVDGCIASVGEYTGAERVIDVRGGFLVPGFIDGHVHPESSYLDVGQYARALVPRGVLGVVTDLHEIANVAGLEGLRYFTRRSRDLPLDMFFMAPSCVPSSRLETTGAVLGPSEIRSVLRWRNFVGLGEVMNFPGVVNGDEEVMAKLYAAQGRPRDGHAPGVRGKALNAYVAAGIGSDHETTTREEGLEKLRRGMYLMIREGSAEKNLEDLMPLVTDRTYHRCILVSDDRNAKDLHSEGDVDAVVRKAIRLGLDPIRAIQMATINPARYFGLKELGAIAPGYWANLMLVADIEKLSVQEVYYRGRLVARDDQPYFEVGRRRATALSRTMNVRPFTPTSLELRSSRDVLPVIGVVPGQIVTRRLDMPVKRRASVILPDTASDVLMLAAVERHHATGNIGVGLVHGFGLDRGALATSVAHDSHNIVVLGVDKEDMYVAVKELEHSQGGLVVVEKRKVLGCLPLPIAGLLSPEPLEKVAVDIERLESLARGIGCVVASPFSVLSFLALPVIPELKLTDRGVVDVLKGEVVSLA